MASVAGPEIERLIQLLARLPGLGPRSARRAALHLIKKRDALMTPLAGALQTAIERVQVCKVCSNIDTQNPCTICTDTRRDPTTIVVVADVADLWALERANAAPGKYHVLGGTLSPLDGVGLAGGELEGVGEQAGVFGGEVEQAMRARLVQHQEHTRADAGDFVRHERGLRGAEGQRRRVSGGHD